MRLKLIILLVFLTLLASFAALSFAPMLAVAAVAVANNGLVPPIEEPASSVVEGGARSIPVDATASSGNSMQEKIQSELRTQLGKLFPGTRIELVGDLHLSLTQGPTDIMAVTVVDENNRGEAHFILNQDTGQQGMTAFRAWLPTWVAQRRVMPAEKLSPEIFKIQDVNVAVGMPREMRGLFLAENVNFRDYEATQSILEGQYPLSSGMKKVPDVRRGDVVQIRMISGEVSLSTSGTAAEPAYIDGSLKVITQGTKRELQGKLLGGHVVEVSL